MNDPLLSSEPTAVRDRTPIAIKADNMIRQRLRIGDPNDPREIAEGLKRLFPKEARWLASEAEGVPVLPARLNGAAVRTPESLATSAELKQATDDIERDLRALTTDHRLKDITAELQGWGQAIRSIIADGMAAARLALDPRGRDRVFAARRQLADYARLARFVGALTLTMNQPYRKLAQGLDEVAGFLLVLAGESLAGSGLGGGRFLLSAPASELQSRRDAVLLALRTLAGTTEQAYGNDQWPWGLHGLRETLRRIEASGHLDLRALLEEPVLGKLMDELIERAAQQNVLGLRALGATADLAVQRLHRLMHIVNDSAQSDSPAVMTFLKALQLFLDVFRSSRSGYRLLFIARAPVVYYGLGSRGPDAATERLIDLVIERGRLATLLDCFLGCECCEDDILCQIILDTILYQTDRGIDLYALGSDPDGAEEPEWRAAAYALPILQFFDDNTRGTQKCLSKTCFPKLAELKKCLVNISHKLGESKLFGPGGFFDANIANAEQRKWITDELCLHRTSDRRLESVIETLAAGCTSAESVLTKLDALVDNSIARIKGSKCADIDITPPPTAEASLRIFHDLRERGKQFGLFP